MGDMKKVYTKFISYYIEYLEPMVSETEWRLFLRKKLGPSVDRASEVGLKDVAFTLYYAHFAGMSTCVRSWDLIERLDSPEKIRAFLIDSEKNRKTHGLYGVPVVHYTTEEEVKEHMKEFEGHIGVLRKIMDGTRPIRASPKRASPASPSTTKSCDDLKLPELRKLAIEKDIPGRSKMNKSQLCKALGLTSTAAPPKASARAKPKVAPKPKTGDRKKGMRRTCKEYNLTELRKLATKRSIEGRSKMSKAQLCKALKIKS